MRVDWQQPVNKDCQLNTGLVSWWLCGENPYFGGGTFRDLCNRNHGTLTNMAPATDWRGAMGRPGGFGSLNVDGINDHVNIGQIPISSPFSVSCWFRVPSVATRQIILARHHDPHSNGDFGFAINNGGSGDSVFFVYTTGFQNAERASNPATNTWLHWLGTYDGSTSRLYENGVQIGATGGGGGAMSTNSDSFRIGSRSYTGYNDPTAGTLDDVRIWNQALSSSEVLALYSDSRQGYPQTLNWIRPTWYLDQAGGGGGGGIYKFPANLRANMDDLVGGMAG